MRGNTPHLETNDISRGLHAELSDVALSTSDRRRGADCRADSPVATRLTARC